MIYVVYPLLQVAVIVVPFVALLLLKHWLPRTGAVLLVIFTLFLVGAWLFAPPHRGPCMAAGTSCSQ